MPRTAQAKWPDPFTLDNDGRAKAIDWKQLIAQLSFGFNLWSKRHLNLSSLSSCLLMRLLKTFTNWESRPRATMQVDIANA